MDGRSNVATLRLGDDFGDTTPALFYNLEDHLGTSALRLNASGAEIDREEYYPFGDSSLRTFDKKRYRYVGKEKDGESGLYYYGARYYMGWVGRFVSVDPLAPKYAQLTPYNYASNRPIGDLDLGGLQTPTTQPEPDLSPPGIVTQAESTVPAVQLKMEQRLHAMPTVPGPILSHQEPVTLSPELKKSLNPTLVPAELPAPVYLEDLPKPLGTQIKDTFSGMISLDPTPVGLVNSFVGISGLGNSGVRGKLVIDH
jgi:RHS repeat-associated protein